MTELNIRFPIGGRDDSSAALDQASETTIEATNVRGRVNGRLQGGRRPGMARFCAVDVGSEGGRALASVLSSNDHVSYSGLDEPEELWTASGPSGKDAYSVRVDSFGDSYTLDGGTHVVIRNSAGVEQEKLVLPVSDSGGICRALEVDPLIRRVYVGVSEASLQARSRLWCYQQHPYRGWEILWEIQPGAFIEKLQLVGTTLYTAQNDTDTGRSYVVTYDNLGTLASERARMQSPASPITTMDVAAFDGDIAVGSGYNSERGLDPRHPDMGQRLDRPFADYWVNDITNWGTRKYCFLDAETLDGEDGDEVLSLPDTYGSNRELVANQAVIHLTGRHSILRGTVPNDGDTITFALRDGTITETYTFKTALTPTSGEVLIGASLATALVNLETAIEDGGNGSTVAAGTEPSTLVFMANTNAGQSTLKCNTQREVVTVAVSGGGARLTVGGASSDYVLSEKDVTTTGPKLKKNGMSGRQCLYFDGVSSRMVTLDNPNKLAGSADEHHTLFPGYGNSASTASSARFAAFFVLKPYPTFTKSSAVAQVVDKASGTWTRRIVSNRNASGVYEQGKIGVVENSAGTLYTHAADYQVAGSANFTLVCIVSNPTGNYEVYVNGSAALNSGASGTGTAVANDSKYKTHVGQSQYAPEDERFWEGEFHKYLCVHSTSTPITQSEREYYEGVLAWHYGEQSSLPSSHPYYTLPPPPPGGATSDWYKARQSLSTAPMVAKYDGKTERLAWIAASDTTTPSTIGGLGYGLKWLSTGNLVTVGPPVVASGTGADMTSIRLLVDMDEDFSTEASDGAWAAQLGDDQSETFSYDKLELAVDAFDNVFIPFFADEYESPPLQFLCYSADGDLVLAPEADRFTATYSVAIQQPHIDLGDVELPEKLVLACRRESTTDLTANASVSDGDTVTFDGTHLGIATSETYTFKTALTPAAGEVLIGASVSTALNNLKACINHDLADPTLYASSATARSELVTATVRNGRVSTFAARNYGDDDLGAVSASSSTAGLIFNPADFSLTSPNVWQARFIESTVTGDSGRSRVQLSIVGSDVWKSDDSTASIVTGGEGVIESGARYVDSVVHLGRVFFTDGKGAWVYDTKTDELSPWVASSGGSLPQRFQLLSVYRGRILVSGIAGRPYSVVGSRVDDPFDFDRGALVDGAQSFDTSYSLAGSIPDTVNGIAPLGDDVALVLCAQSLWQMTGDPAPGANGQFDRLPTQVGGAFGRAWAQTPVGLVIWTSEGEPARVAAGGDPEPIVGTRFRRTFQEIDMSTHYIRMAWSSREDGLYVAACPYGGVDSVSRSFFIERETGAAWEDEREDAELSFTDLIAVDGDNDDSRSLVFACADGGLRKMDEIADDDDGYPFVGRVVIGPIAYKDVRLEAKLSRLQVLLDGQSGDCFAELWASDEPSTKGVFKQRFVLRPGHSWTLPARVRGNYLWLVIEGKSRWAFQMASAFLEPGGVKRRRLVT